MRMFNRKVSFQKHDPLDDGLSDAIAAEKNEEDAFTLVDPSGEELSKKWDSIVKDAKKDPNWFSFSKD